MVHGGKTYRLCSINRKKTNVYKRARRTKRNKKETVGVVRSCKKPGPSKKKQRKDRKRIMNIVRDEQQKLLTAGVVTKEDIENASKAASGAEEEGSDSVMDQE